MSRTRFAVFSLLAVLLLPACQQQEEPPKPAAVPAVGGSAAPAKNDPGEKPPAPPIREDFEGEPKLSLFPRVGDFRPEDDDKEGLSYWATYINHLTKISGVLGNKDKSKGKAFGFRGIRTVESVGFFSPLAVEPDKTYHVSYLLWSKLSPGATTGVGILEYDTFLFIPEQFSKSLHEKHFQRSQLGTRVTDDYAGKALDFTFRTGPKTRMIHLVFFREGVPDRAPVVIDDIEIKSE